MWDICRSVEQCDGDREAVLSQLGGIINGPVDEDLHFAIVDAFIGGLDR